LPNFASGSFWPLVAFPSRWTGLTSLLLPFMSFPCLMKFLLLPPFSPETSDFIVCGALWGLVFRGRAPRSFFSFFGRSFFTYSGLTCHFRFLQSYLVVFSPPWVHIQPKEGSLPGFRDLSSPIFPFPSCSSLPACSLSTISLVFSPPVGLVSISPPP